MTESTRTLLIVGGVAVAAFLIYKKVSAPALNTNAGTHPGTGNNVSAATQNGATGDAGFWNTLGSAGQGLNNAVSSAESTYNNIYDLFGGGSSSTDTGQGNNGTAG